MELKPCKDILPETTKQNTRVDLLEKILNGAMLCTDPQDASISIYSDGQGEGKKSIAFKLEYC